jgi:cytoplasmic iron level regulating protein YaaA (DUF328/UPF0246 family)
MLKSGGYMKFLLAPSKTRNNIYKTDFDLIEPTYAEEAKYLANKIKMFSKEDISKIMNIKGKLLDKTFDEYLNFNNSETVPAILSYTGTVFKELDIKNYGNNELDYLKENVRILSALYGILKPFDKIKIARLDMKMKVLNISNYKFWDKKIDLVLKEELKKDEIIINLSSNEFRKMVGIDLIDIEFKESKDNLYKTVGMYSKKARGMLLNYMIINNVTILSEIKEFNLEGYKYSKDISNDKKIAFTR